MKKLLLLLILSFFSAQGLAGGCPDGSEPVKSISADGTYFVYNCGGQSSSSSVANSGSTIKAIKYESFVDTNTSSSCKELDKEFYRKSLNKCSIIAVLDTKPKFPGADWFKNVWQTSGLLISRVNKDGNLEIVGLAENIQVETGEKTDRKAQTQIASIVVNTEELGSNSVQVIKNPIIELPVSSIRKIMVDVNQDGVTELVIAGMNEDGRSSDSSWREVNYIYYFETESYSEFGKPLYSHDFVAGDLDDDGYDEFIDISWPGPQGDGVGVCNGKTLKCVYQGDLPNLSISKTSLSVYPNKKGGILFGNCDGSYLNWCWSEVTYKNGRIQLKLLDRYIASKKPDKEELFISWSNWEQTRKGWQVPGYPTNERFTMLAESYLSHQFDMDDDGDFDTVSYTANQLCKKPASQKRYKISGGDCNLVGEMIFFRNDDGKFTVSDTHEIEPGATKALYNYDINKDGHMDLYAFRDDYSKWNCDIQLKNIFFGNGDGTFRRPSVMEQSKIFGNYGCEIQSYFFDFEGESYRTFFTHKYSKNFSGTRAVYVGVEKIATKAEKAKRIAEESAKAAELAEENKSSPLFDGRYSFNLFRYHDDEDWQELGNGFVEIMNGELIIDKDNSDLKTGSNELYDTFSGQINEKGKVSGSVELAYLFGKNSTEVFTLNGQIDKKIWGDSHREDFFRVYFLLAKE